MSEEHKAIVRRIIEEFFNTGNLEVVDEIFATDYVDHNPSNPELHGIENIKRSVSDWRAAFPDTHNTIEDMVAEGDKVVARWITRATHQEEFMGLPPTGNQVMVTGIGIFRFSGDKVVESWDEYDALGMLQQLGTTLRSE